MSSANQSKKPISSSGRRISNTPRKKRKSKSLTPLDYDDGSSRHYVPPIDKQLLFQGMIKQFAEWQTWQKHLILCRFTDRSSSILLSTLSTVLEPIFHRDFEIKSKKGFHSSLLETYLDPTPQSTAAQSVRSYSPPGLSSHRSSLGTINTGTILSDIENAAYQLNGNEGNDQLSSLVFGNGYDGNQKYSPILESQPTSPTKYNKHSTKVWKDNKRRSTIKSVEHELYLASMARNLDKRFQRGILHTHIMSRNSGSMSTGEFLQFPQIKNKKKLGDLVKPGNKDNVTQVGQYKHQKWWLPPISKGQEFQRASRKTLLKSFKKIADEFVHKYTLWSNAEKGDFMLHIVDKCSPDEIKFFANCIYQRLEKFNDINNLSDNVLLHTFSFLDDEDLANAAQVCRRWKYLTTLGYIWERKCYDLAHVHGQFDVIKNLEVSVAELDWKQLYHELKESISVIEAVESHTSLFSVPSNQALSEHFSNNMHDNKSTLSEYDGEVINNDNNLSPRVLASDMQDTIIVDGLECEDCKVGLVHSHVSFTSIPEAEIVEVVEGIDSKDDVEDVYKTESEVITDKALKITLEEEKRKEEKDVALDVRVRLVQAQNKINRKMVEVSPPDDEPETEIDYQLIQVNNIKTISRVRKLEGHGEAVLCLQFDSKRVMTGSSDRTVRLWDIRTGRYFRNLVGHQGGVRCLKFDDKYIVTGSWDTTVMIWDVVNFSLICTIAEHSDCVSCIELTTDILITGSYDSTICIFKKHSWELLTRLEEHEGPVSCMALLSEDELLTGSYDKTLLLWDLETFCVLRKFEGLQNLCLCVKVCGSLVAAGASDGTITFWNLLNSDIEGCIAAHTGQVNSLCFVKTRFFSAGSDNVVREWDLSTCTCLRSLRGHSGAVLCLRASAKRVVSGSVDGTARIWDMTYKLQQVGGKYEELNSSIIQAQVLNEQQFKEMTLTAK